MGKTARATTLPVRPTEPILVPFAPPRVVPIAPLDMTPKPKEKKK